jgi:stage II sporulation protein D
MTRTSLKRLLGAAALAAVVSACAPSRAVTTPPGPPPPISETVRVRVNGRIERVQMDRYAAAVALTEIAPGAVAEPVAAAIYEAQIVVARTYAASRRGRHSAEGFDLCDSTHCQRYEPARLGTGRWAALAQSIASRTSRQVLVHGNGLIEAVFHADCGGHTADARDVWGAARPYLVAQRDQVREPHRAWTSSLGRDDLFRALAADRRTRVTGPVRSIAIARHDRSGRAARVRIAGATAVEVDGDVFRAVVSAALGVKALPSTRFQIRRDGDRWDFTGTGFGHGVGMCQTGALARARSGATGAAILRFYYPGAIIRRAAAG